jgi:hypothetical protein
MNYVLEALGLLGLRSRSVAALAARPGLAPALAAFAAGFMVFASVRHAVYADLRDAVPAASPLEHVMRLNLIQAALYVTLVCVPALTAGVALARRDPGGYVLSFLSYRTHLAVLLPLWGLLFAAAAPIQALVPHWIVLGEVGISVGLLSLLILACVYTVWAIGRINGISTPAAAGVVLIAALTLPAFYLLAGTTLVPLLLLLGIGICFLWHRMRGRDGKS